MENQIDPFIEKKGFFYKCNLCNVTLNGLNPVRSHVAGNSHCQKKKRANSTIQHDLPPLIEKFGEQFRCVCCDCLLNSDFQITDHVTSNSHVKEISCYPGKIISNQHFMSKVPSSNTKVYSTMQMQSALKSSVKSDLPPLIRPFGSFYKCICCDSSLNSQSQIMQHIYGTKHLKAKANYRGEVEIDNVQCARVSNSSFVNQSSLSDFQVVEVDELLTNTKVFKADEDIIF